MTTFIDAPKALKLLQLAVSERGEDYIYEYEADTERCLYWHMKANECGCVVGVALFRAGVTRDHLIGLDDYEHGTSAISLPFRNLGDVVVTDEAADVFAAAQRAQDAGRPWGYALDQAKREAAQLAEGRCSSNLADRQV